MYLIYILTLNRTFCLS